MTPRHSMALLAALALALAQPPVPELVPDSVLDSMHDTNQISAMQTMGAAMPPPPEPYRFDPETRNSPTLDRISPRQLDVPYILCDICKRYVAAAHEYVCRIVYFQDGISVTHFQFNLIFLFHLCTERQLPCVPKHESP